MVQAQADLRTPVRSGASRFSTLAEWLSWQHTLSPSEIDLGLERVQTVAQRMGLDRPPFKILTVGGTNGKGSAITYLDHILRAANWRTGVYTSPHLLRYNERIRIAGEMVDDQDLCAAFAIVDEARGDIPLTFFEFGTLAALTVFRSHAVAVALLEVGLGGRLDAVNAFPSEGALVTSIGIDHTEWLGTEREQIGWEKAGIYRSGKPAVCADRAPPERLIQQAEAIGARLILAQRDYHYTRHTHPPGHWDWHDDAHTLTALPLPALAGDYQIDNAAGVLALLSALGQDFTISVTAIQTGLSSAHLSGRMDRRWLNGVEVILDVAHNLQAAEALTQALLQDSSKGQTQVVLGMLAGKDSQGVARALAPLADVWHLVGLEQESTRGSSAQDLWKALQAAGIVDMIHLHSDVATACAVALNASQPGDRLIICGSFFTVAAAMRCEHLEEIYRGSSA